MQSCLSAEGDLLLPEYEPASPGTDLCENDARLRLPKLCSGLLARRQLPRNTNFPRVPLERMGWPDQFGGRGVAESLDQIRVYGGRSGRFDIPSRATKRRLKLDQKRVSDLMSNREILAATCVIFAYLDAKAVIRWQQAGIERNVGTIDPCNFLQMRHAPRVERRSKLAMLCEKHARTSNDGIEWR